MPGPVETAAGIAGHQLSTELSMVLRLKCMPPRYAGKTGEPGR
nr:MAG TPA: hypothetical protein [Caudoviricetes sp.]